MIHYSLNRVMVYPEIKAKKDKTVIKLIQRKLTELISPSPISFNQQRRIQNPVNHLI